MYSEKEEVVSKRPDFVKRNGCILRKTAKRGESLYSRIVLKNPELIHAIEQRVATSGMSPATVLAAYVTKAFTTGVQL